jgi:hypothetical protein
VDQPCLDPFHRDKDGTIARKLGKTRVDVLRRKYGPHFAFGESGNAKVADILHRLDELSLRQLIMECR